MAIGASMKSITVKPYSLWQLRALFEMGIFAVPKLQREFVWNAGKACQLLDSIYHNLPIGSALVWKTDQRSAPLLRTEMHALPAYNHANKDIYFLIDGQQRLSVLWQILRGSGHEVENASGQEIHFGNFYFNADPGEDDELFVYRTRRLSEAHVPVVELFAPRWRRRLPDLGKRTLTRIHECRERLLGYKVLITFAETRDIDEVRETFIRINSLGTPIRAADKVFAQATSFDLREGVRQLQAGLQSGFDRCSEEVLLLTISLAMGGADVGGRALDTMIKRIEENETARNDFRRLWPKLKQAVGHAVDYMVNEFGVANYGFLPSDSMIATLALFFFHNDNRRPSAAAKRQLRAWFWATAVGARYAGRSYRPSILNDAKFVERLATKGTGRFTLAERIPLHVVRHTDYSRRSMLTDGYFCLLRLLGPCYLEDGEPLPKDAYSTRANRHDKHHIFPRQQLANNGISAAQYNCIANICFVVARENQRIGSRAPKSYLEDVPQGSRQRKVALQSHLIPDGPESGLWDDNLKRGFKTFVAKRTLMIAKAFEERAGIKLFASD